MNPIQPIAASTAAYKAQPVTNKPTEAAPASARAGDTVEISGMQNLLATLRANDIRTDKVADIKARIEAGTYETDDKLNIAIDRLLDDLS